MTEKPTVGWRRCIAEEAEELAAGNLDPGCACMAELFPEALLAATDEVLDGFEGELAGLDVVGDEAVLGLVERVVLGLNAVHHTHEAGFDTGEREDLCGYIDQALTEHGIDVTALTARHGLARHELTDKWREW
ncbi:hypothetical protein [Streptomyces griseosporeus]|uniref:hypothetical protein n=1 Tax=Streptomyces griseosporeus TaxID=1910 RepID=UPI003685CBAB